MTLILNNEEEESLFDMGRAIALLEDGYRELGELVIGRAPGRTRPEELLFYKNNSGMGIQMAAAGRIIYDVLE